MLDRKAAALLRIGAELRDSAQNACPEPDGPQDRRLSALSPYPEARAQETGRSRIKRLRGLLRPQYRLRVDDIRIFYDVSGTTVEILAIVPKSEAESWLAQFGSPE